MSLVARVAALELAVQQVAPQPPPIEQAEPDYPELAELILSGRRAAWLIVVGRDVPEVTEPPPGLSDYEKLLWLTQEQSR